MHGGFLQSDRVVVSEAQPVLAAAAVPVLHLNDTTRPPTRQEQTLMNMEALR